MKTRLRISAVKFTNFLAALDSTALLKFPTISSLNPVARGTYCVNCNSVFKCTYYGEINVESCVIVEVEVDGVRTEEAHFRGRKLQGATISLPSGYSGFVLGQESNRNANGKRKACCAMEENPCWEVKAKFDKMTYWNHDSLPQKTILSCDLFIGSALQKHCTSQ